MPTSCDDDIVKAPGEITLTACVTLDDADASGSLKLKVKESREDSELLFINLICQCNIYNDNNSNNDSDD